LNLSQSPLSVLWPWMLNCCPFPMMLRFLKCFAVCVYNNKAIHYNIVTYSS
jgi:hypothetical protein